MNPLDWTSAPAEVADSKPNPPSVAADAWVVCGPAGSGKTTVAMQLANLLYPVPAILNKDMLFGGFVAALLAAHGRHLSERDGHWYDTHIKLHEYGALTTTARAIRESGCPVILDAPFTQQIREENYWQVWREELGEGAVHVVWVHCDSDTLYRRLRDRCEPRDTRKLNDFETFMRRSLPDVSPPIPHLEIDNRGSAPPLAEQVQELVNRVTAGMQVA